MAGLFFGNGDINVSITAAQSFNFGFLNKSLIVTDEDDFSLQKFSSLKEVTDYLTANTITAPNLIEAVTKFLGQVDVSGNSILPEYFYILGVAEADVDTSASLLTAAIESITPSNDFYCIIPTFASADYNEWFVTYANTYKRIGMIYDTIPTETYTDVEKSLRACSILDENGEFKNSAWAGRVVSQDNLVAFKWKNLAGCTTSELSDADIDTLEGLGKNGYRKVRGNGETTGSRALNNTSEVASYIDTIIVRDNIIYNVAGALHDVFIQNEIVPMGDRGRKIIQLAISSALNYVGSRGLIEQFEDGSYQFTVTVPKITSAMRSARELSDVTFSFVPTIPMEKIVVTGQEILEWIEGGVA